VNSLGQQRLAVMFHRILMRDGYSASLDRFHGLSRSVRPVSATRLMITT